MAKARVLVLTPTDDPGLPAEDVKKFKAEMDAAGVDYKVIAYPKTKHAFSRPDADSWGKKFNLPWAYDPEADRKSWAEMQAFFNMLFRK